MSKNPRIEVEITPAGFDIKLTNWEGVNNVTLEHMHYAVVKKFQVAKAQKLGALHGEKIAAEAAARKVEASKTANINEELANALLKVE